MAALPAYKPPTPFTAIIPGGFQPSLMIRIRGKMTSRRGRCAIDFLNSNTPGVDKDIIFHVSIRMDQKVIVRNSYKNKHWELEERYGAFRISYYDPFEIVILAEYPHYKIAVNGVHLGIFRHRAPLNLVHYVQISGDIEIEHVLFEQDVKSAQEQAALGYMINSALSLPVGTHYRIGASTHAQPANATYMISSATPAFSTQVYTNASGYTTAANASGYTAPTAVSGYTASTPSNGAQGYSSTQQYPAPPAYSQMSQTQGNLYPNLHPAPSAPNDPPPPYQQTQQQPNQTWLSTPFFELQKQPGRLVLKTEKGENSLRF